MKRTNKSLSAIIVVITIFILAFSGFAEIETDAVGVSASSAVLIEANSGKIIYEKNCHIRKGMASTTKIMTALVAIENGDLDMKIRIPREAVGIEGSSLYLIENEELTLHELLYGLMLRSANDAAVAIAIAIGGSTEGFADMMNARADEMGLENTHFVNPHGLDSDEHYTTAYDLAIITSEALKNQVFQEIVSTYSKTLSHNGVPDRRIVVNHNRLLKNYKGCIGVKTGFTKKCGRCLVSAAERDGVILIAVTLGAPNDWKDHTSMLDYGFDLYESVELDGALSGEAHVVGGINDKVSYSSSGKEKVVILRNTESIRRCVEMQRFYYAPIKNGDVLGHVVYYEGDNEIASFPIIAQNVVNKPKPKKSFVAWIKSLFN